MVYVMALNVQMGVAGAALVLPIHGSSDNARYSLPCYLLAEFPLYLVLAALRARNRCVRVAVIAGCLFMCLLLTLLQAAAFAIA